VRAPTLLLVLASTHRDGFLRERAVRLLEDRSEPVAAAALAVRAVEHVSEVREIAREALRRRTDATDAAVVVPILLAARGRRAAAGALDDYLARLAPESVRALVRSADPATRAFATERAELSADELIGIAARDPSTRCRTAAAHRALDADPEAARTLLDARPAGVRALAVDAAPDALVRERLPLLLLDRAWLLRRAAQRRATALGEDAAALYRRHLPARPAIAGLGEVGSEADVDLLVPLVGVDFPPGPRRAAIRAVGSLAPRETRLALLPPLLEDEAPGVVREAARQLRRLHWSPSGGDLDRLLRSPHVWTRRAALALAVATGGWDAAIAALALYDDREAALRETARSTLGVWLTSRAPSAGDPRRDQRERLATSLARSPVPADVERLVRFHAGL
jgi:hypothetical protein